MLRTLASMLNLKTSEICKLNLSNAFYMSRVHCFGGFSLTEKLWKKILFISETLREKKTSMFFRHIFACAVRTVKLTWQ